VPHRALGSPRTRTVWLLTTILNTSMLAGQHSSLAPPGTSVRNEWSVFGESWAGGVQYLRLLGGPWRAGAAVGAGPFGGVTLARGTSGLLREWATAYMAISVRSDTGAEVIVSPIGAALAVGDDFGAIYPTAQVQLGLAKSRLRISSVVRAIRIAGGNRSGTYWSQWIPLRIGYALGP